MKAFFILSVLFLTSLPGFSQTQKFPGELSDVKISPVYHGSLVIEYGDLVIYIDPYGGAQRYSMFKAPDVVLITHADPDHFDPKTLDSLDLSNAHLIAPEVVTNQLLEDQFNFGTVTTMANGVDMRLGNIGITSVPMYNLPVKDARHKKGVGNGYILSFNPTVVYISGDTEGIPEVRNLRNIDVAFLCMNLPYTMDVEQAANTVLEFQPGTVYPYHYRGKDGFSNINLFKKIVDDANMGIEVKLLNWYPGEYTLDE